MKRTLVGVAGLLLVAHLTGTLLTARPRQAAGIQVEESKLGKDVKDRQISDETADFAVNDKVYLALKVTGGAGESIKVTWKNGDHSYTTDLAIGGTPWRTWCYKTAALAGDWTVTVADSKGNVLKEMSFKVK